MPVFNVFFRVLKKSLPSMLIYLTIFMGIAVLMTSIYKSPTSTDFQSTKANVAIINRDEDSTLIRGLKEYLAKSNILLDLPDNNERLEDELFYHNVDYITIIPAGFTADFQANSKDGLTIQKVIVPDSSSARYVDIQVEKYLDTYQKYVSFSHLTADQCSAAVSEDLSHQTPVTIHSFNSETTQENTFSFVYYFGYLAYVIIALIVLGISTIMMVFNQSDLRRRNLCSPLKQRNMNFQLALGCIVFSLLCWAVLVGVCFLLDGQKMINSSHMTIFCMLNSLVFTFVCVAIGFLVGILIKSFNAQGAIANVLSLGMCFLCGVFVPQSIMSKDVLRFSCFLPAYWYIKANDTIGSLTDFSFSSLSPIYTAMLIQVGFAVAIFSAALLISRQKRTSNQ